MVAERCPYSGSILEPSARSRAMSLLESRRGHCTRVRQSWVAYRIAGGRDREGIASVPISFVRARNAATIGKTKNNADNTARDFYCSTGVSPGCECRSHTFSDATRATFVLVPTIPERRAAVCLQPDSFIRSAHADGLMGCSESSHLRS